MTQSAPSPAHVRIESDGAIATIVIDRPERRNALNMAIKNDLTAAVRQLSADPAVGIVILTGSRDYFVGGTDIGEMAAMTPASHVELGTNEIFRALRASEKIVIAAVEGYALGGGCELALNCDMIVAGDSARFAQPEINVGIMPGGGGTQALARSIGRQRAMKLLLTGEPFAAADAFAMGLVSEVVPAGTAREAAAALARTILSKPPLAVAGIRALVRQGPDMPLEAALDLERKTFMLLFGSTDQKEGMQAFLEKRPPRYTGR